MRPRRAVVTTRRVGAGARPACSGSASNGLGGAVAIRRLPAASSGSPSGRSDLSRALTAAPRGAGKTGGVCRAMATPRWQSRVSYGESVQCALVECSGIVLSVLFPEVELNIRKPDASSDMRLEYTIEKSYQSSIYCSKSELTCVKTELV